MFKTAENTPTESPTIVGDPGGGLQNAILGLLYG